MSDELRELVTRLEEQNAAKDKFISILSHDLRNPMTGIKGYASLLRQNVAGEKPQRWLNVMIEQIDLMTRFINDLLDIMRYDEGRLNLETERLDLRDLVRAEAEAARKRAEAKGVALALELPASPVMALAEPERLANALRHLLDNAVKFTGDAGRVGVRLTMESGQGWLTVEDDGTGISPEIRAHLFDKLQSVYWTERLDGQGSGLGLPLVSRLMEAHGGEVSVESEMGRGSRFTIRLPLA